jgi:hypothetical protein
MTTKTVGIVMTTEMTWATTGSFGQEYQESTTNRQMTCSMDYATSIICMSMEKEYQGTQ